MTLSVVARWIRRPAGVMAMMAMLPTVMPAAVLLGPMAAVGMAFFPMSAVTVALLPMPAMTMSFRPVRIAPMSAVIAVGPGVNPVPTPFGAVIVTFVSVFGAWPVVPATSFALGQCGGAAADQCGAQNQREQFGSHDETPFAKLTRTFLVECRLRVSR